MTATDELKPCPFCGCEARTHETIDGWIVSCDSDQNELDGFTHMAHGYGSTEAEAIAAWNRRAAMTATDELRKWAACELASWKMSREMFDKLTNIADRIDAEHESACAEAYGNGVESVALPDMTAYVKLPVDADGVPIRVGDVLDGYSKIIEVVELRIGRSGWVIVSGDGNAYADTFAFSHHHEPTVEDVLRELLDAWDGRGDTGGIDLSEFATKLRLAGDAE